MNTFLHPQPRTMFRNMQLPKHTFVLLLLLLTSLLIGCNMPTEATSEPPLVITPSAETTTIPTLTAESPTIEPTTIAVEPTATTEQPTITTEQPTTVATQEPTAIPTPLPTLTPIPTPTEIPLGERIPNTFDELEAWLLAARLSDMPVFEAHRLLNEAGWLAPEERPGEYAFDFQAIDLSGDARAEWLVVVKVKDSQPFSTPRGEKYAGNMYVVADDAVVAWFENEADITNGLTQRPQILSTNDITGDGIQDAIVEGLGCGANRCFGKYQLLTYHLGYLDDLASAAMQDKLNPHLETQFNPTTGEQRVELSVWKGVGLQGVRETEIYAWNGSKLAYVETLTVVPDDAESLKGWLVGQWQSGADFANVQGHLREAGWLQEGENLAASADLSNNTMHEWAFVITDKHAEPDIFGHPSNVWVVNPMGVFSIVPEFMSEGTWTVRPMSDVTGNGTQEFLAIEETCGAHTCFQSYFVLAYHDSQMMNLAPWHVGGVWIMQNSYSDWRVEEYAGSPALMIHGGGIGSVGAGIVRLWTDVFVFSAEDNQMRLVDTLLDDTNWRHHLLYEANDKTRSGHAHTIETGIALYERVIEDDSLDDDSHFYELGEEALRHHINQYAAFRLIHTWLRPADLVNANSWLTYLQTNYAGEPLTLAATAMMDEYDLSADLAAACSAAQAVLADYDEPTGILVDMGYGNPSLDAESLCP